MAHVDPPLITKLLNSTRFDDYNVSTLKVVQHAEAPLSIDLIRSFEAKFPVDPLPQRFGIEPGSVPRCRVIQSYGSTETSFISAMNTAELAEHSGRVGKIVPSMQARIVGIGSQVDVEPGEPGELWLRGAGILKGYWKDEQATKDVFAQGGWFKTGDLAKIDEHGYFSSVFCLRGHLVMDQHAHETISIVDRVEDLIKYKEKQGML